MNGTASTSRPGALGETYRHLPRAMKWLLWLVLGLLLYFAIIEPAVRTMADLRDKGDTALTAIRKYNKSDKLNVEMIADGRKRWGNVLPPGEDQTRVLTAREAIIGVLGSHGLASDRVSVTERSSTKLKMTDNAASSVEYSRGPIEVKFSAKPHVAMQVIGELEMVPSIARVFSVRIRRQTDKTEVEVTLVADAWFTRK